MVVGTAPTFQAIVLFHWQCQMARLDPNACLQPLHERGVVHLRAPVALEGGEKNALIVLMWGKCAGDARDFHMSYRCPLFEAGEFLRVQPVMWKFTGQFGQKLGGFGTVVGSQGSDGE